MFGAVVFSVHDVTHASPRKLGMVNTVFVRAFAERVADLRILCPAGDQTPAQQSIRRSARSAAVSRSRRHVRTARRTLTAAFDDACDRTHYADAGAGGLDINSE